jgi:diaminopimelate decarboxylase
VSGFAREDGVLFCDGASLEDAARRFGTPLYVYSAQAIRDAYRAYAAAFSSVPHRVCYAVKANGSGAVLRLLASLGAGADIVSGGELRAALRAGFTPDRIVFSGVGKTEDEIALGLEHGVAELNAESEAEIETIAEVAARLRRRARLSLRVNPNIDAGSHPYISTGLAQNKFGVDIALAEELLTRARARPSLNVVGVQCHIGSQILDTAPLAAAARELAGLARRLLNSGFALETIDFGGGLGVDYQTGAAGPDPASLAAKVLPELAGLPLTLLLEPGRYLIARAGVLLTRVLYLKENRGKRFVIVDAGMNDLLRPSLYQAVHRIEPVVAKGGVQTAVDVVGPVCETGDFFARGRALEQVAQGELLALLDAGAYGFVMASNYNMRPRPAEALVDGGEARLVRRRESFDDLVRTELSD